MFVVWDANSGDLTAQGALMPGGWRTFSRAAALSPDEVTIVPATPWPTATWAPTEGP